MYFLGQALSMPTIADALVKKGRAEGLEQGEYNNDANSDLIFLFIYTVLLLKSHIAAASFPNV